jgi:DNA-binding beta-propeller fold protein YncE
MKRASILWLLLALLTAGSAQAAVPANHPFLFEVTKFQVESPSVYEELEGPCGIGLDSSGNIYVGDYYANQVAVFGPDGGYLTRLRGEDPADRPCAVAVDPADRIFVNNFGRDVVVSQMDGTLPNERLWSPRQALDSNRSTGLFRDPVSGRLYVDNRTYIAVYEEPVEAGDEPVEKIGLGSLGEGYGVAVSSYPGTAGHVYVADAATDTVKVYDPATSPSEPVAEIDGEGTPEEGFTSLFESSVAVSPTDGHVYVVDNLQPQFYEHPEAAVDEFNAAGDFRWQFRKPRLPLGPTPLIHTEPAMGLAVNQSGDVYITSGNSEAARLYGFGPSAPAYGLQVEGTGTGVGTVVSEPAGIRCGGACAAEFTEGIEVTLTAVPDPHSSFDGWGGACAGTGPCTVTMSEARALSAGFSALPQQALTVTRSGDGEGVVSSVPAGIECGADCSGQFNEGSTVTLVASAAPHGRLVGWSGCTAEPTPTECEVAMSSSAGVVAEFAAIPQQTLEVAVTGEGSVTSEPEIACPPRCSEDFDQGDVVHLTAHPAAHHRVEGWSGCTAEPSPRECLVSMSAARSVSARFAPIHQQLHVSVSGPGTVAAAGGGISACGAPGGSCSATFVDGETVLLTAAPTQTSVFLGWTGGTCSGRGTCEVSLGSDLSLGAEFAPLVLPPPPLLARVSIGKVSLRGSRGSIEVTVSGPGAVSVTGKGLARASARSRAAGPLRIPLELSSSGKRKLRRARTGRLRIEATVQFTLRNGSTRATASEILTFRSLRRSP